MPAKALQGSGQERRIYCKDQGDLRDDEDGYWHAISSCRLFVIQGAQL